MKKYSHLQPVLDNKKGYVMLISVLVLGSVLVSISVASLVMSVSKTKNDIYSLQLFEAKALADACAEEALQQIRDSTVFSGSGSLTFGLGSCDYNVLIGVGENRSINASGQVGNVIRKVQISIDTINPLINIIFWQEVGDF